MLPGDRVKRTLGDIGPLNKVLFKRAISRVKRGPHLRGLPKYHLGQEQLIKSFAQDESGAAELFGPIFLPDSAEPIRPGWIGFRVDRV